MMGIEMLIDDQLRNGPEARAREAEAAARERDMVRHGRAQARAGRDGL